MMAILALYDEAAGHLRSSDTARHHARRIGRWCELYTASQARACAAQIVKEMRGAYAIATINRSLGALKRGLHLAWEANLTPENYSTHVKRLPENNARDVYLTMDQVKQIADKASEATRAAIWIALLTGCRRGEVCQIKAHHIGEEVIHIPAGNTKTLRTRSVPIVPALRPWLEFLPLSINQEGIKSGFRRAREAAGMPEVHFHDLRHSCASILIASGASLYTVSKILGHASIKSSERYSHMELSQQRSALEEAFK